MTNRRTLPLIQPADISRRVWLVRVWDGLALILLIGWAGGLHVNPGLRDFAPPKEISLAAAALLAIAAGAIRLWGRVSVEEGVVFRAAAWLFERWHAAISRAPVATLTAASAAVALLWSMTSLRRHWALGSNDWDLGIYTNGLWNLTHGFGYVSSLKGGMHLFGDHQTPTYWLLAPLFSLWPHAELLLIVQAVAYTTTGAALAVMAAQYGGRAWWGTAALPLLYWNYLPARNANAFDARPDSFMVPLFCWAIAGLQSRSASGRAGGAIALLLAIGCKETAAMIAVAMGIAWLLGAGPADTRGFTRRLGGVLAIFAGVVFYVDTTVVPQLVGATYSYGHLYSHYGPAASNVVLAPITDAREFWRQLTQHEVFSYLVWTLGPLGFISALDWCAWVVSGPASLALFLVNTPYRINLDYQYSNEISIGVFWALSRTLPMLGEIPVRRLQIWVAAWAIAASGGSDILRLQHYSPTFHDDWVRHELTSAIGADTSVAASDALVPHLAARHSIGNLTMLKDPDGSPVTCIVTDAGVGDRWVASAELEALIRNALSQGYRQEFTCGAIRMLARDGASCLQRPLRCPM